MCFGQDAASTQIGSDKKQEYHCPELEQRNNFQIHTKATLLSQVHDPQLLTSEHNSQVQGKLSS